MNIYRLEVFKKRYLMGAIIAIEILLDVLELLNVIHVENGVDTIYSFWQMLSWIFIVGYCIWDYYGYFYLCNDTMLLLSPRSKYEILKKKGVIYFEFMMLYFMLGLVRYLALNQFSMSLKIKICGLYFISKIVAVISFLFLLIFLLQLIKNIDNKFLALLTLLIIGGVIVGLEAYFLCANITSNSDITWIIGVVDGKKGINSYACILPISFINENEGNVVESFYIITVYANILIGFVSYVLSKIMYKTKKYNYVAL